MANLNIGASLATVNTLASLPVDKGTIYATLSAPSNLSLATAMYQGQVLEVIINPSAFMNIPMPTASGWYSTFGETLTLMKDVRSVLKILCIGSGQYLISSKNEAAEKTNGYDCVDLGLPSGTLWATCNIGANDPWEYGKYFQWGATEGYYSGTTEVLNHTTYETCPFNNGSSSNDYNYFGSVSGTVCPNGILAKQYDAASVNLGGNWRMPTQNDFYELTLSQYTTESLVSNGNNIGFKLTSKSNGNSIIFPASSIYMTNSDVHFQEYYNKRCFLWASDTIETWMNSSAHYLEGVSNFYEYSGMDRMFYMSSNSYGLNRVYSMTIRGVIKP